MNDRPVDPEITAWFKKVVEQAGPPMQGPQQKPPTTMGEAMRNHMNELLAAAHGRLVLPIDGKRYLFTGTNCLEVRGVDMDQPLEPEIRMEEVVLHYDFKGLAP